MWRGGKHSTDFPQTDFSIEKNGGNYCMSIAQLQIVPPNEW